MVIIENNKLRVEISEVGAEVRRVTFNGKERFWRGDPNIWEGVSPILFPICGAIKEDKFIIEGKEYNIPKHGFARKMNFEVESHLKNKAVFLLKETEETLKIYPWSFEFRVEYLIKNNKLNVKFSVKNTSTTTLYTSVGGHEAYNCDDGLQNYDIIFDKKETIGKCILDGSLIKREKEPVLKNSRVLPMYYTHFFEDALVFNSLKSTRVKLRNRITNEGVTVDFKGFDYLLLWAMPNADYLCIEPWTSGPSYTDDQCEIEKKEGMTKVKPNKVFVRKHIISFW